ncbi:hypothetical protein M406DRAFT_96620 [Cryphonectria parasitica EP155]|uniref:RRM domain-containing protein n=1 Tax=Cryphonectria parasitica (strain ATCC 38755 / EP155) TaxID=660469 RepID=A0A9P4YBS9_CRYP1|nr:uncharacterized protein M406DRAFT_96620 [Cryphonectria parasitica EP155]KAF3769977.1 hypothetical protein M406DRAFT_96620 [Cryphonectria parasitica EP155]
MASLGGETVTIDRTHFETMLRRANFNPDELTVPLVSISQSEYDELKKIAAKYEHLCYNLLRGGVGEDTIGLLSMNDAAIEQQKDGFATDFISPASRPQPSRDASNGLVNYNPRAQSFAHVYPQEAHGWDDVEVPEDGEDASSCGGAVIPNSHQSNDQDRSRLNYERQCNRSLLLSNLAEGTTYSDLTKVIRGGLLLNVHMRPRDHTAVVAFLQAADAQAFFDHIRRHDLYIRQKRVDVRWDERRFIMPAHVASNIRQGATRNLVLRRCDPDLTEAVIRDDLDHIHNLVVIRVEFRGGSCYIETNSVHNAMFARTCMRSRGKYKQKKIEWDVDECCQPLEQPTYSGPRNGHAITKKRNSSNMANRFDLLNLDDDDDDEEEG